MNLTTTHLEWTDATGLPSTLIFDCVLSESWDEAAQITDHPVEQGKSVVDNIRPEPQRVTLKIFATNQPIAENNFQGGPVSIPTTIDIDTPPFEPGASVITYKEWKSFLELKALSGVALGAIGGAIAGKVGNFAGAAIGVAAESLIGDGIAVPEVQPITPPQLPPFPTPPAVISGQQLLLPQDFVALMVAALDQLLLTGQLITVVGSKKTVANMAIERIGQTRDADTGSGASFDLTLREIRFVSTLNVPVPSTIVPQAKAPVSKGAQATTPDSAKDSVFLSGLKWLTGP